MSKHKSEDFKISAVDYYIENDTSFAEIHQVYYTIYQNQNLHVLKQTNLVDFFVGKNRHFKTSRV